MEIIGNYWQLLGIIGNYWQLLAIIGNYWQLLGCKVFPPGLADGRAPDGPVGPEGLQPAQRPPLQDLPHRLRAELFILFFVLFFISSEGALVAKVIYYR